MVVWLHGGGFFMGAGHNYDAQRMAERGDVVVVMPQHQAFIKQAYGTRALPIAPTEAVRKGLFHRVPVLSGTTKNENMSYSCSAYADREPMGDRTFDEVMSETFGADEEAIRSRYPRSSYDNAAETWGAITTDAQWSCQQYETSLDLARYVPVYQYEFADPNPPALTPTPPKVDVGAQHASDLWSFYDIGGYAPDFTPEQQDR